MAHAEIKAKSRPRGNLTGEKRDRDLKHVLFSLWPSWPARRAFMSRSP
jgi:hypothetical protein